MALQVPAVLKQEAFVHDDEPSSRRHVLGLPGQKRLVHV